MWEEYSGLFIQWKHLEVPKTSDTHGGSRWLTSPNWSLLPCLTNIPTIYFGIPLHFSANQSDASYQNAKCSRPNSFSDATWWRPLVCFSLFLLICRKVLLSFWGEPQGKFWTRKHHTHQDSGGICLTWRFKCLGIVLRLVPMSTEPHIHCAPSNNLGYLQGSGVTGRPESAFWVGQKWIFFQMFCFPVLKWMSPTNLSRKRKFLDLHVCSSKQEGYLTRMLRIKSVWSIQTFPVHHWSFKKKKNLKAGLTIFPKVGPTSLPPPPLGPLWPKRV